MVCTSTTSGGRYASRRSEVGRSRNVKWRRKLICPFPSSASGTSGKSSFLSQRTRRSILLCTSCTRTGILLCSSSVVDCCRITTATTLFRRHALALENHDDLRRGDPRPVFDEEGAANDHLRWRFPRYGLGSRGGENQSPRGP